jgi:hypothetical protein
MSDENFHHKELLARLDSIDERFKKIDNKLNPMYDIFVSAKGLNNIAVWILKGIILVGASVTVIYSVIKWLKE